MATMGKPAGIDQNPFKNIGMAKSPLSKGDILNKLSGNKNTASGVKFIDKKDHNKMGKDSFMKLLTFQMANQDPTNPMDQKKFASDLAQFSQLEQLSNLNSKFEKMQVNESEQKKFYAASFLGKEAVTKGATVELKEHGASAPISFNLPENASKVLIRVIDEKKQMVAQIEEGNMSKGNHRVSWNGKTRDLINASKGNYNIEVFAWDHNMEAFQGKTQQTGLVTGVEFEDGETILILDGKKSVTLRDVDTFRLPMHNSKAEGLPMNKVNQKTAQNVYEQMKEIH